MMMIYFELLDPDTPEAINSEMFSFTSQSSFFASAILNCVSATHSICPLSCLDLPSLLISNVKNHRLDFKNHDKVK